MTKKSKSKSKSGSGSSSPIMPALPVAGSVDASQMAAEMAINAITPNKATTPAIVQEKLAYYKRMIELLDSSGTAPDTPQMAAITASSSPPDSVGGLVMDDYPFPTSNTDDFASSRASSPTVSAPAASERPLRPVILSNVELPQYSAMPNTSSNDAAESECAGASGAGAVSGGCSVGSIDGSNTVNASPGTVAASLGAGAGNCASASLYSTLRHTPEVQGQARRKSARKSARALSSNSRFAQLHAKRLETKQKQNQNKNNFLTNIKLLSESDFESSDARSNEQNTRARTQNISQPFHSPTELQIAAEFSVVENNKEIINEQKAHRDGDLITTPPLAAAVQAELKSATLLAIQTAAKASQNAAATAAPAPAKANRPPQIVVHLRQQQQQQQQQPQQQQQHNLQQQLPQTDGIDSSNQSVQVISDIDYLTFLLNNHSPAITDYVIKLGGQGTIRILPKTSDVYRHIINVLKLDNTFRYNTYQLREDRSFRVVVRGLHSSTPPQRIRNELTELGYTPAYICHNIEQIRFNVLANTSTCKQPASQQELPYILCNFFVYVLAHNQQQQQLGDHSATYNGHQHTICQYVHNNRTLCIIHTMHRDLQCAGTHKNTTNIINFAVVASRRFSHGQTGQPVILVNVLAYAMKINK
ncbi:hypothetical protein ACLKA6_000561 [Drosophila palustris]